ncbi:MAG TPA: (Fe-S)-binding protein [Bacteroidia bacterium]|nr:(Fe-S)-binding protein [Bacteroidota bacterium]MCW5930336.1 (Fe-S)-binding protein [Bacteroidota bacterium]HNR49239.1 (Fe-S)-binding protein [Bacteroidia bacterium]HNT82955.1 (Fe-S)-binding protein [Bacteroidia bacterium]
MIVDLFIPCYMDQVFPETANNVVKVLEKLGCGVNYNVEQTCCGRTAFEDGYQSECKAVGEKLIREFQNERFIVCPGSYCSGMIKTIYPKMFHNSSMHNEYKSVQKHIYEFSDFLVNVLNVTDVGAKFLGKAVFMDSCKAVNELHVKESPRVLLNKVRGLELMETDDNCTCCGYSPAFTNYNEPVSADMAMNKLSSIQQTGAELVISTDYTCLMHLQSVAEHVQPNIKVMHIADVLAAGW